jgi:hypothetical protein
MNLIGQAYRGVLPKIIFLDLDGPVFNHRGSFARTDWEKNASDEDYDVTLVYFLDRLFYHARKEGIDLKLVMSTSWRLRSMDALKRFLCKSTLDQYLHEDWHTTLYQNVENVKEIKTRDGETMLIKAFSRGGEIQEWLDRHPEVDEYKIIDDDPSILEKQQKNWIQCDSVDGFSGKDMRRLINWVIPANKLGVW